MSNLNKKISFYLSKKKSSRTKCAGRNCTASAHYPPLTENAGSPLARQEGFEPPTLWFVESFKFITVLTTRKNRTVKPNFKNYKLYNITICIKSLPKTGTFW